MTEKKAGVVRKTGHNSGFFFSLKQGIILQRIRDGGAADDPAADSVGQPDCGQNHYGKSDQRYQGHALDKNRRGEPASVNGKNDKQHVKGQADEYGLQPMISASMDSTRHTPPGVMPTDR